MRPFLRTLLLSLLPTLTSTSRLFPRDAYSTIQTDLFTLYNCTDNVTSVASHIQKGSSGCCEINFAEGSLVGNLTSATKDLNSTDTPVLGGAQSSRFLGNLTNTLYPKLKSALDAVVAAKTNIGSEFERDIQSYYLSTISKGVTSYGGAVVSKVPAQFGSRATQISGSLSSLVASAFAVYNSTVMMTTTTAATAKVVAVASASPGR